MHWLAVAFGGAIGATLRYLVAGWVQEGLVTLERVQVIHYRLGQEKP